MASKAETKAMVQDTLAKFYCDICSKGYANVGQWEEHIQSYGHNHAKRKHELAMQSRNNKNKVDEVNKRREKEKKREQQELERMVKAAGGVLPGNASSSSAMATLPKAQAAPSDDSAQAAAPASKKGGFFKVAGSSAPAVAPSPTTAAPPPPPDNRSPLPPPPPSMPRESTQQPQSAPRFASSSSSSLASTFVGPPPPIATSSARADLAREWKPSNAPALHPLLSGVSEASTSYAKPKEIRSQRNDFFKKAEVSASAGLPHELPTAASSQRFAAKTPKGMSFVPSASTSHKPGASTASPAMSLAKGPPKKKALDMGDDDEEEEGIGALPTGRPKAQKGKIGFGFG